MRTHSGLRRLLVAGVALIAAAAIAAGPVAAASGSAATAGSSAHKVQIDLKKVPAGRPHDAVFGCQTDRGPAAIVCFRNGCGKSAILHALMTAKEHSGGYGTFLRPPSCLSRR